jgi:hypothetical protein
MDRKKIVDSVRSEWGRTEIIGTNGDEQDALRK